jgi:hypothetical protein
MDRLHRTVDTCGRNEKRDRAYDGSVHWLNGMNFLIWRGIRKAAEAGEAPKLRHVPGFVVQGMRAQEEMEAMRERDAYSTKTIMRGIRIWLLEHDADITKGPEQRWLGEAPPSSWPWTATVRKEELLRDGEPMPWNAVR